jgi:hypothetical protein
MDKLEALLYLWIFLFIGFGIGLAMGRAIHATNPVDEDEAEVCAARRWQ